MVQKYRLSWLFRTRDETLRSVCTATIKLRGAPLNLWMVFGALVVFWELKFKQSSAQGVDLPLFSVWINLTDP